MGTCEHCTSTDVRWFTPTRAANRAAVLLCMDCEKLTIVPPRIRHEHEVAPTERAA